MMVFWVIYFVVMALAMLALLWAMLESTRLQIKLLSPSLDVDCDGGGE